MKGLLETDPTLFGMNQSIVNILGLISFGATIGASIWRVANVGADARKVQAIVEIDRIADAKRLEQAAIRKRVEGSIAESKAVREARKNSGWDDYVKEEKKQLRGIEEGKRLPDENAALNKKREETAWNGNDEWEAQKPTFGEDWDKYFRSEYGDNGVTWWTKGKSSLAFKSGYDEHLISVQDFNRDASKGIIGGHNLDDFYNYFRNYEKLDDEDFIHKITPHPTIDGIIQINYKIPKLDNKGNLTGEYKHFKNPKTLYDPSKISDKTIIEWGKAAMQQGKDTGNIVGRKITGIAPNGLKFEGYMDAKGIITNFYPIIK